jgi:hypothetical protein
MFMTHARLLENLEKPRSSRARARATESLCRGVCVRPKMHFRAQLNPHTPKMRTQETAGEVFRVPCSEKRSKRQLFLTEN